MRSLFTFCCLFAGAFVIRLFAIKISRLQICLIRTVYRTFTMTFLVGFFFVIPFEDINA